MADELKPCPFKHRKSLPLVMMNGKDGYWVACQVCHAWGPLCATERGAKNAWNRRTEPTTGE